MRSTARSYPSLVFLPLVEYLPVSETAAPRTMVSPCCAYAAIQGQAANAATNAKDLRMGFSSGLSRDHIVIRYTAWGAPYSKGWRSTIVSARSGPVEMIAIG